MTWRPSDDEIDALVRARLEKQAESIDPRPHFERIRGTTTPPSPPIIVPRRRRSIVWMMAATIIVLVGGFLLVQIRPAEIAAESIVRESKEAHRVPLDRCYLVDIRREPGAPPFPPRLDRTTVRLWTRDDRFWMEWVTPLGRGAWGRDADGSVWLTSFNGRIGSRLDADEVPPWLSLHCDLSALQLDTLMDDMLTHFRLERSEGAETTPATLVITATPKLGIPRPPLLRRVVLEIDAETRIIRRAVISRGRPDQLFATTIYTLVESQVQDDEQYRLEGHLRPGAEILTRTNQPARRQEILARFFGPGVEKWLKPTPKDPS